METIEKVQRLTGSPKRHHAIILHFSNDEVWSRAQALADEVVEELNDRKSTAILTRAPGTLLKLV